MDKEQWWRFCRPRCMREVRRQALYGDWFVGIWALSAETDFACRTGTVLGRMSLVSKLLAARIVSGFARAAIILAGRLASGRLSLLLAIPGRGNSRQPIYGQRQQQYQ